MDGKGKPKGNIVDLIQERVPTLGCAAYRRSVGLVRSQKAKRDEKRAVKKAGRTRRGDEK